jgi:hypothetical protein
LVIRGVTDLELESNEQLYEYLSDLKTLDRLQVSQEDLDRFRASGIDRSDVRGHSVEVVEHKLVHQGVRRGPAEHISHALCEAINPGSGAFITALAD